jgi:hypothetical protein
MNEDWLQLQSLMLQMFGCKLRLAAAAAAHAAAAAAASCPQCSVC